ncbi:hypothetical protein B0H17DRAFT_1136495 [Mycena rosella]|uniref:Uncharacterized protein n=1 Tax=Mycena rosella TaxID=1033263 RepID=A0AAD7DB63_MYCRO|nr:hypothetical protein B0H17DRAFT_1136495 [Mycena rosella]
MQAQCAMPAAKRGLPIAAIKAPASAKDPTFSNTPTGDTGARPAKKRYQEERTPVEDEHTRKKSGGRVKASGESETDRGARPRPNLDTRASLEWRMSPRATQAWNTKEKGWAGGKKRFANARLEHTWVIFDMAAISWGLIDPIVRMRVPQRG